MELISSENQELAEAVFLRERKKLLSLAYGMLGSMSEAEDVVQEAYLRLAPANEPIRNPEAWLTTVVSRLAIDRLRSAQHRREVYPGEWLPEPVLLPPQEQEAITRSRLSIALLHLLEKLEPEQRAIFVLREVFERAYREIAEMLGKSEAACRQIMARARTVLAAEQPSPVVSSNVSSDLVSRFIQAISAGDEETMLKLLAPHATLTADGGGKTLAVINILHGADRIMRFFKGLRNKYGDLYSLSPVTVNSEPGIVTRIHGQIIGVAAFAAKDGLITAIYSINNPEKLPSQNRSLG